MAIVLSFEGLRALLVPSLLSVGPVLAVGFTLAGPFGKESQLGISTLLSPRYIRLVAWL